MASLSLQEAQYHSAAQLDDIVGPYIKTIEKHLQKVSWTIQRDLDETLLFSLLAYTAPPDHKHDTWQNSVQEGSTSGV